MPRIDKILVKYPYRIVGAILILGIIITPIIIKMVSAASTTVVASSFQTESGTIGTCATKVSDSTASNSGAVSYGTCSTTTPPVTTPSTAYGAQLPISYSLSSLTGTIYYVSPSGSDSNAGTNVNAPLLTLSSAISKAPAGSSIVIRGGTYRNQGAVTVSRTVHIVAYPGETPIFDGSQDLASGWTTSGTLSYHAYTAIPPSDAGGISFSKGINLTGGTNNVGMYPDQAWVGTTTLQQVTSQSAVTAGKFYVDSSAGRIYLASSDVAKGSVTASKQTQFMRVYTSNVKVEGLTINKYSDTPSNYGVILVNTGANYANFTNDVISNNSFFAMYLAGGTSVASIMQSPVLNHVSVLNSNFMGVNSNIVDGLTVENSKFDGNNRFGEYTSSPVSGAVKTSRSHGIYLFNNQISNNKGHGLWFDQSNEDVEIANSQFTGTSGDAVFFEISDNLYLVNNYIDSRGGSNGLKAAGSSGLHLVNNTFVGGTDPVAVYTDSRSLPGCSDPATNPICPAAASYPSVIDRVHPHLATMDWMPRIDMMLNNVIAYPTGTSLCGSLTDLCITNTNASASQPMNAVIHKADSRGIPQTVMDGNVYAAGSNGVIIKAANKNYTTTQDFSSAMAGSPVSISGIDANAKYGSSWVLTNGQPTAALTAANGSAIAVPSNTIINKYLSAGIKRYGYGF